VLGFDALATLTGETAGDNFGYVVDRVGDIDGDGTEDFIVGAPLNDAAGANSGRAYVYSGAGAALLFTESGAAPGENFGWSVAAAGDVDGDGVGDFIIGAPATGAGAARVYSGATGALLLDLSGPDPGARFGDSVIGIGDTSGDGRSDLLIGAEDAAGGGQAFVVSGMDGSTIRSHTGTAGTKYGYGVGALGDASGDGVADYAIGGGFGAGGLVEARSGSDGSVLYMLAAGSNSEQLGFAWINSVGDVDNDAHPDFFAADIADSSGAGRGYLVSGVDGTVIRTFEGTGTEVFGIGRNGGQDVNGDGVPDLHGGLSQQRGCSQRRQSVRLLGRNRRAAAHGDECDRERDPRLRRGSARRRRWRRTRRLPAVRRHRGRDRPGNRICGPWFCAAMSVCWRRRRHR
jgi:hypothetical protein